MSPKDLKKSFVPTQFPDVSSTFYLAMDIYIYTCFLVVIAAVVQVIARGDLSSARNPSAALLARIRDASQPWSLLLAVLSSNSTLVWLV